MFLETWGILYYGFLARLPLIWREWERFLSSISGLNTLILGEQGVSLANLGHDGGSCPNHHAGGCQTRGQEWSEPKPPLPVVEGGVTKTMQSCGNAQVPNNFQEMSTQTEVTSSTLATMLAGSCGELTPIQPRFVFVYSSKAQWHPSNPVLHRRPSGASFPFKKLFILK